MEGLNKKKREKEFMDMFNGVLIVGEGMGGWRHKKVWGG